MVNSVKVLCPRVYLQVPHVETQKDDWANMIDSRLPNIFVVRPSVFLNSKFDYFLRNDGTHGFTNFTLNSPQSKKQVIDAQATNLTSVASTNKNAVLMCEEFPLTLSNALHYPTHYRVHMFHDVVGCIQVDTQQVKFWMDEAGKVLDVNEASPKKSPLVDPHIPAPTALRTLCSSARTVAKRTLQPYIRIDFVLSTRGPMFRSFACMPGDVRSPSHRWFYAKHDETFEKHWVSAIERIQSISKSINNANSKQPSPAVTEVPDDN